MDLERPMGGSKSANAQRMKRRLAKQQLKLNEQKKREEVLLAASNALEVEERKRVSEALAHGVFFTSNGNNCVQQRGVIGRGTLLKGCSLPGNAVRSWKKLEEVERRLASRNKEIKKLVLHEWWKVDVKDTVSTTMQVKVIDLLLLMLMAIWKENLQTRH